MLFKSREAEMLRHIDILQKAVIQLQQHVERLNNAVYRPSLKDSKQAQ